jgi:hypothetical protein
LRSVRRSISATHSSEMKIAVSPTSEKSCSAVKKVAVAGDP